MWRVGRCLPVLVLLAGCRAATTSYEYPDDLTHPNPVKRSMATIEFARLEDGSQLPEAFRLLLDRESSIRAAAHETIRDLSGGEDFGYLPYLPDDVRIRIVARWQAWWVKSRAGEASGG